MFLQYFFTHLLYWPWIAFWVYWLIAGMFVKRVAQRQSAGSYFLHRALMVPAFFLLFDPNLTAGWLGKYFLLSTPRVFLCGIAITVLGLAFACWARAYLGGNWSASVTVKQDHTLTRTGPYRWVRHPIYTGMLLGALGSAVSVAQWRGLCGTALMFIGFYVKARYEEKMMTATFGAQYDEYKRTTGMLVPLL